MLALFRAVPVIFFCMLVAPYTHAQSPPVVKVRSEGKVSMQVVNVPLNEVLAILAKNVPMDIKGAIPSQESVTLEFSNLSLEEALRRIMRGYNYVLVHMDEPARPVLTVMTRAERVPFVEPTPAAVAPSEPAGGLPRPRASVPPGIVGSPAGPPPGVGAPVPGPLVQPRPARQTPAETPGEAPSSAQQAPVEPRQPTQAQQAEPTVVMTPFGYRTEEPETPPQPAVQAPQLPDAAQLRRFPPRGMMPPVQPQ